MMFINLNKESSTPLYEQLYQDIKNKILNGSTWLQVVEHCGE